MRTLVVIPARGGSKGIPRKNLRPFGGRPLIEWAIAAARAAQRVSAVVVTTDSAEIGAVAQRAGADVVQRSEALARDEVTLDPVVHDALVRYEAQHGVFDCVLTVQPTSPLLRPRSIDAVVEQLYSHPELDTVLTAVDDTHLAWEVKRDTGQPMPAYVARVNRQALPKRMRETGGVLATRRGCITPSTRVGERVGLYEVSTAEGLDIDNVDDWLFAEAALCRRRIAFVTIGTRLRGLGHVTRVMSLMESLSGHVTKVFCAPEEDLAIARLSEAYFPFELVERGHLANALRRFCPDVVIHDELDTDPDVIQAERAEGYSVVCFEDGGPGAAYANLIFNALYPEEDSDPGRGRYNGHRVYVLRDEFRQARPGPARATVANVLVTFGGGDPAGLTEKVVRALAGHVAAKLTVIAGKGIVDFEGLSRLCAALRERGTELEVHRDVQLMSYAMAQADIAFCSAGRTVYELVHMQVPAVVLAQNELELRHVFAGPENGCLNLGLGSHASDDAIVAAYRCLALSEPLRAAMRRRMAKVDLRSGRDFVLERILNLPQRLPTAGGS